MSEPGFIYVFGALGSDSPVKIGWSANPFLRLSRLQTMHPEQLTVIATFEGTKGDEAALHSLFARSRAREGRTEWFERTRHVAALLDSVFSGAWHPRLRWLADRPTFESCQRECAKRAVELL